MGFALLNQAEPTRCYGALKQRRAESQCHSRSLVGSVPPPASSASRRRPPDKVALDRNDEIRDTGLVGTAHAQRIRPETQTRYDLSSPPT
jgi:hypothetical protein